MARSARVWLFQASRDIKRLGERSAPWQVGWYEGSNRRQKKVGTKSQARLYANRLEDRLNADEFTGTSSRSWKEYREEYKNEVLATLRPSSQIQSGISLDHVERILGPKQLTDLTRQAISRYASVRLAEKRGGKSISRATINKELRCLRAFLREAAKRNYLSQAPAITMLKEPKKLPTYVDEETFGKLYAACDAAEYPAEQNFSAGDWWRAYLLFLYLTGWRCSEPLSLVKEDVDHDRQLVRLKAENNKGGRDEVVPLHPMILEHLGAVQSFGPAVFPWEKGTRRLWVEFHRIQDEAGVKRSDGKHFGFHDLRRGFASMNADRVSADVLQTIMRHKSYSTTQRYINLTRQLNPATANLFVPELKSTKTDNAG